MTCLTNWIYISTILLLWVPKLLDLSKLGYILN